MQTLDMVYSAPGGLHLRPAAEVVRTAEKYGVRVRLSGSEDRQAEATSILGLLLLGINQGSPVHVEIEGGDEQGAATRLSEIFSLGGGI